MFHTNSISQANEAARRRLRRRICKYVEEADDAANKVSRRKRVGMLESRSHLGLYPQ